MNASNEKDTKTYQEAIESLRQLNNDLFYDELKTNLDQYIKQLETSYTETKDAVTSMSKMVPRITGQFNTEITSMKADFFDKTEHLVDSANSKIKDSIDHAKQKLSEILDSFHEQQQRFDSSIEQFDQLGKNMEIKILQRFEEMQRQIREMQIMFQTILSQQNEHMQAFQQVAISQTEAQAVQTEQYWTELNQNLALETERKKRDDAFIRRLLVGLAIGELAILLLRWI
ncbi:hypothetical protein [Paenibacillus sp. Soil724D2]|uniref:hypothetical protein n=1 Tax=Paenibacillus sp. (strain Soil724D2) TaxID=1736392 RepID=UPI0007131584|nr:hypothetical protein [Paenibacillus sp. Soil724D2]KRE50653.1 hypothetical protein ASG85_20595 [Paenibacillus sp. Soil724D2]